MHMILQITNQSPVVIGFLNCLRGPFPTWPSPSDKTSHTWIYKSKSCIHSHNLWVTLQPQLVRFFYGSNLIKPFAGCLTIQDLLVVCHNATNLLCLNHLKALFPTEPFNFMWIWSFQCDPKFQCESRRTWDQVSQSCTHSHEFGFALKAQIARSFYGLNLTKPSAGCLTIQRFTASVSQLQPIVQNVFWHFLG